VRCHITLKGTREHRNAGVKPAEKEQPLPPELAGKWLNELANYRDSNNEPEGKIGDCP